MFPRRFMYNTLGVHFIFAMLQGGDEPPPPPDGQVPPLNPVAFPVDLASVSVALVAAMALVLLLYFGVGIGFRQVRRLVSRLRATI